MAYRVGKKSKKRKRQMERAKESIQVLFAESFFYFESDFVFQKVNSRKSIVQVGNFPALHLVYDPQGIHWPSDC